ncbi:hypothetical protein [Kitasatospora griseola]|uniref:hypothetical protein n=1 Tax=Kitasatospora griseola TaxID=2064 RepID=UPI003413D579
MTATLDQFNELDEMIIADADVSASLHQDAETIAGRLAGYRADIAELTDTRRRALRNGRRAVTARAQERNAAIVASADYRLRELADLVAEGEKYLALYREWADELEALPVAGELPAPVQELPSGLSYRRERITGHGPGDRREFVAPGRYVVLVEGESPWATERPEVCLNTTGGGVWLGEVLVCLSCGLDCT